MVPHMNMCVCVCVCVCVRACVSLQARAKGHFHIADFIAQAHRFQVSSGPRDLRSYPVPCVHLRDPCRPFA